MTDLIHYFIRNRVAGYVAILLVLIFGLASLKQTKSSFFAPIDPKEIVIQVRYPGASPKEIEEGVVLKIEDKLKGIQGIERTLSQSSENAATITIEVKKDRNSNQVLQDVKNAVDSINSFPIDMEPLVVFNRQITDFAIRFALYGNVSLKKLKETAQKIERDLRAVDGISLVSPEGYPDEEIEVTLKKEALETYGVNLADIAGLIRAGNIELTGGVLKDPQEELLIRGKTKSYSPEIIANIPVKTTAAGATLRLGDIASVKRTWADSPARQYFNGKRSVSVRVDKSIDEDILFISNAVNAYIQSFNDRSTDIKAHVTRDGSIILNQRIKLLTKNGIIGFFLVIFLLATFLNLRLAIWVAIGIPLSFMGMFILGQTIGLTINVISLFGMIVVVGILVDDGIIISENIFQKRQEGQSPIQAAVNGTMEVLPSVVLAILTTIVAFAPFFFLDGRVAEIMSDMATVVILTLAISLIEGLLILPAHLIHFYALESRTPSRLNRVGNALMGTVRDSMYAPTLRFILTHKLITILVPVCLFALTIGAVKGGIIKSTFFPYIDSDSVSVTIEFEPGTRDSVTQQWLDEIESAVWQVNAEFKKNRKDGLDVVKNIEKYIDKSPHSGGLRINLLDGETRDMESFVFTQALRKKVPPIPNVKNVTYGSRRVFGKPIAISLLTNNLDQLNQARDYLIAGLKEFPALKDVVDNDKKSFREIYIQLKPAAYSLGLTYQDVMRQIRRSFFGLEAQRLQVGLDEIRVWVRLDRADRESLSSFENLKIANRAGELIPLKAIARLSFTRGVSVINHLDGQRELRVEADLANQKDPVPEIYEKIKTELLPTLFERFPEVSLSYEGQRRQSEKLAKSAKVVLPITLVLMFCLIALAFQSFGQAAIVFLLIPFGYIGVAWGHAIHGLSISILSTLGIIALIGIIVNDSIVFINTYNRFIREGYEVKMAIYEAGMRRLRPILLTSMTTIAGLMPLILEKSRQAQFLIPMAIAVAYGLLFATAIILVMLPTLLLIFNRTKWVIVQAFNREPIDPEMVEPAWQRQQEHDNEN